MPIKTIEVGKKFYNPQSVKNHVVRIFLDDDCEIIVYKYWSKKRQGWIYKSDELDLFLIGFDYGWKWI